MKSTFTTIVDSKTFLGEFNKFDFCKLDLQLLYITLEVHKVYLYMCVCVREDIRLLYDKQLPHQCMFHSPIVLFIVYLETERNMESKDLHALVLRGPCAFYPGTHGFG